jgi:biopolymer transport protein ExbD
MNNNIRRRKPNEINAGSMADIAFLLLIFFLVATTVVEEKGILVRLPAYTQDAVSKQIADRNLLSVKVNRDDRLLVDGKFCAPEDLKERAINFIENPENDPKKALSPRNAVISLQHDRGTSYKAYLETYNELKAAYNEMRADLARRKFGLSYEELSPSQEKEVRRQYPMVISEAEPTEY